VVSRIRVRLFAVQRELAGRRQLELELPDDASIETAWLALVAAHPALAAGRPAVRFARNGVYADPTETLSDGDELACIPPVSGGAGDDDSVARARIIELRTEPFGLELLAELGERLATDNDGAICGFVGRTRSSPGTPAPGQEPEAARHAGRLVEALDYEAHEAMAERILESIADEIEARFKVARIAIVHRLGAVPLGAVSVAVVTAAPHRDAAFQAARYAIDELKARAPIWKAEQFVDGHVWIGSSARSGPLKEES
jgi:MoaE-MoaD fusion protein